MSYLLYLAIGYLLIILGEKYGTPVDDTTWIVFAILTGAEVISWSLIGRKK